MTRSESSRNDEDRALSDLLDGAQDVARHAAESAPCHSGHDNGTE
jgi:hypothetical protein